MNRYLFALFVSAVFATDPSGAANAPKGFQLLPVNMSAPATAFRDPSGVPVSLDEFTGRVIILNVWATWCGPCVAEIPSLDRLAERLGDGEVAVIAVSQDKGGAAVARTYLEKLKVRHLLPHYDPSGRLSRDFAIRGLPTTFVIAPDRRLVARVEGSLQWDADEIISFVSSLGSRAAQERAGGSLAPSSAGSAGLRPVIEPRRGATGTRQP